MEFLKNKKNIIGKSALNQGDVNEGGGDLERTPLYSFVQPVYNPNLVFLEEDLYGR